jgi:hypothetical protein
VREVCWEESESEKQIGVLWRVDKGRRTVCGYSVSSRVCDMAPKLIVAQVTWLLNRNSQKSRQPLGAIVVLAGSVLSVLLVASPGEVRVIKSTLVLKSHCAGTVPQ